MKSILKIPIRGYHIDHFGHVNHARYLELLEEARWHYLEEHSLIEPIHVTGAIHVVSGITIEYRYPARAGQVLRFETQIAARTPYGFRVAQNAFLQRPDNQPGKTVVTAIIANTFVDHNGRPKQIDEKILEIWPDLARSELSAK